MVQSRLREGEAKFRPGTKQRTKIYHWSVSPRLFMKNPGAVFFDLGCHKWKKKRIDLFTVWRKNIIINSALICWVGSNSTMFNFRLIGCSPNAWNPLFPVYIYIIFDIFWMRYTWQTHVPFFLGNLWARTFSVFVVLLWNWCRNWCLWLPCCFLPCHRLEPHLAGEQTWRNVITAKRTRFFPWSQPLLKGHSQ